MKTFEEQGYQIVKNSISVETAEILKQQFLIYEQVDRRSNTNPKANFTNDLLVDGAYYAYAPEIFEGLMVYMQPIVESVVGKKLLPTYSYARIYRNGSYMRPHKDRPSCEYSVTLTVDPDPNYKWPIWFEDKGGKELPFYLSKGDMCIYKGTEMKHWRDTFHGKEHIQCFLHYVDAQGKFANFAYDERGHLGVSKEFTNYYRNLTSKKN
jgi:hypothetical protein